MKYEELAELPNEELLKLAKTMKKTKLYDAVIFGFLIGVAIYATFSGGFGLLTFLPLVYLPIAGKNKTMRQGLKRLMEERELVLEAA